MNGKTKKARTIYTPQQICYLEERFAEQDCPNKSQRRVIAYHLQLSEHHVQVWFQNRRAKQKRKAKKRAYTTQKMHTPKPPSFWPQNLSFDSALEEIHYSNEASTVKEMASTSSESSRSCSPRPLTYTTNLTSDISNAQLQVDCGIPIYTSDCQHENSQHPLMDKGIRRSKSIPYKDQLEEQPNAACAYSTGTMDDWTRVRHHNAMTSYSPTEVKHLHSASAHRDEGLAQTYLFTDQSSSCSTSEDSPMQRMACDADNKDSYIVYSSRTAAQEQPVTTTIGSDLFFNPLLLLANCATELHKDTHHRQCHTKH